MQILQQPAWVGHSAINHGFFARTGGVSRGIYASLNCGFGSNDSNRDVAENRGRIATALGLAQTHLLTVYQIHSAQVIHVTAPWAPADAPKGDAMVCDRPGIGLGILTADCAPILFADASAGVIAAAHAGWRGALDGVVEATVDAMTTLGARRAHIDATIGPCIAQPSYEVGPDFPTPFLAANPANERFFKPGERSRHWQFDLAGFVLDRLATAGVNRPTALGHDTYTDPQRFFSYRRATHAGEPDYGRNLSVIGLAPA